MKHDMISRHWPADSDHLVEEIAKEMEVSKRAGVLGLRRAIDNLQTLPTMHALANGVRTKVDEAIKLLQVAEAEQRKVATGT